MSIAITIANANAPRNSNLISQQQALVFKPHGIVNHAVMDITDIRRRNLRDWIDSDPHSMGNVAAWCAHYSQFAKTGERDLNPAYLRQLVPMAGDAVRPIGEKAARRLERIGGKPKGWLDIDPNQRKTSRLLLSYSTPALQDHSESDLDTGLGLFPPRLIPVIGEARSDMDDSLGFPAHEDGALYGYVPAFVTDKDAYALRVRGDSMHPRYVSGEYVVISPEMAVAAGDYVVATLTDGRKMLRVFGWQRDGETHLSSINPAYPPVTVESKQVRSLHAVVGTVHRSLLVKK